MFFPVLIAMALFPSNPVTGTSFAGTHCPKDDPNHICLAVKYVSYRQPSGKEVVSPAEADAVIYAVNRVWKQCEISFEIEEYQAIDPKLHDLAYRTSNYSELLDIRETVADRKRLVLVTTGPWNRSGSLGNTKANAWTTMPGKTPYGVVLERPVGNNANLVAHELGHYLNLPHVSDSADLMNPIIYGRSTRITESECETARAAALQYWSSAVREDQKTSADKLAWGD